MPHFEWVPSDQNIADPISRFDNGVVEPHWTQVTTCLDEFWKFLLRIADGVHFATSDAVDLAMKLQLKSKKTRWQIERSDGRCWVLTLMARHSVHVWLPLSIYSFAALQFLAVDL